MKKRNFAEGGPMEDMSDVSPEDVAEMKKRMAAGRAYNKAMPEADTTTGDLNDRRTKNGQKLLRTFRMYDRNTKMPNVDTMGNTTGYKKGGMTASKRADGIAQRGKTRGTMVMCGGGYTKGK